MILVSSMERQALIASLSRPIHGTSPLNLIEKIVRLRIIQSNYWQQYCFAMNGASLVNRAVELEAIGGVTSENNRPSPFLCLVLKLLQITPDEDIVQEMLINGEFKYMRALACFYIRLTGQPAKIYSSLEPLLADYSKLRVQTRNGWKLTTMDAFVSDLLRESFVCDVSLPHLVKRSILETNGLLAGPYISPLSYKLQNVITNELDDDAWIDAQLANGKESDIKTSFQEAIIGDVNVDERPNDGAPIVAEAQQSKKAKKRKGRKEKSDRSRKKSKAFLAPLKNSGDFMAGQELASEKEAAQESVEEQNKLRARLGLKPLE